MSDLMKLPLSEILSLAGRAQEAERRLTDAARALGETPPAPVRAVRRATRKSARKGGGDLMRASSKPRRAATTVRKPKSKSDRPCAQQAGGPCKNGRCGLCRDARAGAVKPARKSKPGPAKKPEPAPAADGPRCDGAWMARARMKFKQQPAVEFLPGVQTVLKRCAAGDWPLLSEVPAVIR